jgi:hypothetical protein
MLGVMSFLSVHVDPRGVPVDYLQHPTRSLPEGITISQIYKDFMVRLHGAAMESIKAKQGDAFISNLLLEQKVQYILTVPNAWLAGEHLRLQKRAMNTDSPPQNV